MNATPAGPRRAASVTPSRRGSTRRAAASLLRVGILPVTRRRGDRVGPCVHRPDRRAHQPQQPQPEWAAAVKASGVRPVTLHAARHFAISAWLSDGVPVIKVSEYAGHADPGVTWRVYAHAISDDNSRARLSVERTLYGTA